MIELVKVDTADNAGDNWFLADFGVDVDDNKHYILTTNYLRASETEVFGTTKEFADLVAKLVNEYYNEEGHK